MNTARSVILGIVLSYCVGIACIIFRNQATEIFQGIIDHLAQVQSERMNTPVADEDKKIGTNSSVLIGIVIIAITAFAHSQAG